MTRAHRILTSACSLVAVAALGSPALSAPQIRFQTDAEGDFVLIGSSLAQDCANGSPPPSVGTVGACGSSVSDQSPDIFWIGDDPAAGQATASTAVTPGEARSTAVLTLPSGVEVLHARLYWAAQSPTGQPDTSVLLERPGVFSVSPTADVTHEVPLGAEAIYESGADVTDLVRLHGSGAYRVGDVLSVPLANLSQSRAFAAWSLVVFYRDTTEPLRQLTLFDGLDAADSGAGITVNVSGFLVPNSGIDAKLGIVAYGSDGQTGGDTFSFNGTDVSDGLGGTNNFFNGSRTLLGVATSTAGDLPRYTGGERSHAGVDFDVVDVTTLTPPGSTSASMSAKAGGDSNVLLGAVVTSITTYKPNFNDSVKSAVDVNGGSLLRGDTLRYVLEVINTGNDPGVGIVLEDALPPGVTYVPDSIEIVSGANAGLKTDPALDDQAEYDAGARVVRVRLGTGATATLGGAMGIGETALITFDVIVDSATVGTLSNQATIRASGVNGAPTTTFTSTNTTGGGSTDVVVDECGVDGDCPSNEPHCLIAASPTEPNICVECLVRADCSGLTPVCDASNDCVACSGAADCTDPAAPACQTTGPLAGACTECAAGVDESLCGGADPLCLPQGFCGCTDADGDSECGAATSGVVCNGLAGSCVPGCSKAPSRNDCPPAQFCSDVSGAVGTCSPQPCLTGADCPALQPVCDTTPTPHECVQCLADGDCTAPLVCNGASRTCAECTPSNTANCSAGGTGAACLGNGTCGCAQDSDCGFADSGRICDGTIGKCATGCRGSGGNGCPVTLVCTSVDATAGTCVECVDDGDCTLAEPFCDPGLSECAECLADSDCPNAAPVCAAGVCTGCTSDADCTDGTLPACQGDGSCGQCSGTNLSLCTTDRPLCLPAGVCGCTDTDGDAECGAADSGVVCSGAAGSCVPGCSVAPSRNDCPVSGFCDDRTGGVGACLAQCLSGADCTVPPNAVCDTSQAPNVCVECTADGDCTAPEVCDTVRRTCVGCVDDGDCPTAPNVVCNLAAQQCVGCLDDGDCTAPDRCNPATQQCVGCLNDGDCTAPDRCDLTDNLCVRCLSDGDCTAPEVCDTTSRTCVGCVDDTDCPLPLVCNAALQSCVGCLDDTDCPTPQGCDVLVQACVDCLDDGDCTAPEVCDATARQCVGCLDDGDCTAPERCETALQRCVQCLGDGDCTAPEVCDTATHLCVGCVEDDDCAPGQRCNVAANLCVGCLTSADCTAPDICDAATNTCVGCVDDADCTGDTRCDTAANTCVECLTNDDCTAPDICDAATNTCVECVNDDVCRCDTAVNECVGCQSDQDCVSPLICDAPSGACVECTASDTGACDPGGAGAACIDNECGCTTDGDCATGRICSDTTSACEPGCRGQGGNGCVGDEVCTSTTAEPGDCVEPEPEPEPEADAGAGGAPGEDFVVEGGGCACSVPTSTGTRPAHGLAAVALGLALVLRRRTARRAAPGCCPARRTAGANVTDLRRDDAPERARPAATRRCHPARR